mmetsp:Transcript_25363/g.53060  ORF Transcript_25363/g.53060 Transcript_25363/m.53060 type:complete len:955 (-) Transcript_25363:200-3064(-)
MSSAQLSPGSTSGSNFFPASQPTPDSMHSLAQRKQQLAHLQNLQRQQQQMLQQLHTPQGSLISSSFRRPTTPQGQEERNERSFSGGMRSPSSPMSNSGSVHFAPSVALSNAPSVMSIASNRPSQAAECDYDINPTELYVAVQKKDWETAAERAGSHPHEAATWVSRKEADGKLRWRLLPLHAAIIFKAPEKTVSALLVAFSQGAACKDDQGMLPLHLAFRNGCEEEVVNLLLMSYPQSVEVQDRKGRIPMVLAQQSSHANRDAYIRALERGAAYHAVTNAAAKENSGAYYNASGSMPLMPDHPSQYGQRHFSSNNHLSEADLNELEATKLRLESLQVEYAQKVQELEAELAKTQETSQVLVDHVNSLEAQLASRSDTERFLATKIANLDKQLTHTTKQMEETEANLQAVNAELEETNASLKERAETAEAEAAEYKIALDEKHEIQQKVYKLTNKERHDLEDRVAKAEREAAAHQANAAVLEAQLKKKIETEHALASQVSMLAAQLATSASNTSEATASYAKKCDALTEENKSLKTHIAGLEKKLSTVATALDAMAAEQERIVEAATQHERTMAKAIEAHHRIVADTARQESLLEDAAKEREQIVSILMRQAEDAERTMGEREQILEAVREQEQGMIIASNERDMVVQSVNKQKEYMDFMLKSELRFLKMTESEEEQEEVIQDRLAEMEKAKEEFLATADNTEEEQADEEEPVDDEEHSEENQAEEEQAEKDDVDATEDVQKDVEMEENDINSTAEAEHMQMEDGDFDADAEVEADETASYTQAEVEQDGVDEEAHVENERDDDDADIFDDDDDDDADAASQMSEGSKNEAELKAQIAIEEAMLRRLKEDDQVEEVDQLEEQTEDVAATEFADEATNSEEFHDATADEEIAENMNHLTVEDQVQPAESEDFVGDVAADAVVEDREVETKESLEDGPVIEQNTVVQSTSSNEQIDP